MIGSFSSNHIYKKMYCQHFEQIYDAQVVNSQISLISYGLEGDVFVAKSTLVTHFPADRILHGDSVTSFDFGIPLIHMIVSQSDVHMLIHYWDGICTKSDVVFPVSSSYQILDGPSIICIDEQFGKKTVSYSNLIFENVIILLNSPQKFVFQSNDGKLVACLPGNRIVVADLPSYINRNVSTICPIRKGHILGSGQDLVRAEHVNDGEFMLTLVKSIHHDSTIVTINKITDDLIIILTNDNSVIIADHVFPNVDKHLLGDFLQNGSIQIALISNNKILLYNPFHTISNHFVSILKALTNRQQLGQEKLIRKQRDNEIKRKLLKMSNSYSPIKEIHVHRTDHQVYYHAKNDGILVPIFKNQFCQTRVQVHSDEIHGRIETSKLGSFFQIDGDRIIPIKTILKLEDHHPPVFGRKFYVEKVDPTCMTVICRLGSYSLVHIESHRYISEDRCLQPHFNLKRMLTEAQTLLKK